MRLCVRFTALLILFACGCRQGTDSNPKIITSGQIEKTAPFRSFFPCLDRIENRNQPARSAALKGPDWELKSTIRPECFPERDLVFSTKIQNPLMAGLKVTRTKMWVTKKDGQTYARVLEGGTTEQQLIAISFATNGRCTQLTNEDCHILLWPIPRVD